MFAAQSECRNIDDSNALTPKNKRGSAEKFFQKKGQFLADPFSFLSFQTGCG
jgi:hypothetical protein